MVSLRHSVALASIVVIVAAACSDATGPGPLDVSVALARSTIARGDTTHLTATVHNISTRSVTFNNVCAFDVRVLPVGEPTGLDHLPINVALSRNKIMSGDTTTVVVRFTNTGSDSVSLPLFCQHLFEVANADGEIVAGREPMLCIAILVGPDRLGP